MQISIDQFHEGGVGQSSTTEKRMLKYIIGKVKGYNRLQVIVPSSKVKKTGKWYPMQLTVKKGWIHEPGSECKHIKYKQPGDCRHVLECRDAMRNGTFVNGKGMRITSKTAYQELLSSGVFMEDAKQVLEIITKYPNVTDKDIQRIWNAKLKNEGSKIRKGINSVNGRRNWLMKDVGVVFQSGTKPNRGSGVPCITWQSIFGEVHV